MNKKNIFIFWTSVFLALWAFLEINYAYHFYYVEQENLFLFTGNFFLQKLSVLAGFSDWLSVFFVQFWVLPHMGALIMAALLTVCGLLLRGVLVRIAPKQPYFILSLLPLFCFIYVQFDYYYRVQGTVAYLLMLTALYGYVRIQPERTRRWTGILLTFLLFWLAGSVSGLFALSAVLFEKFSGSKCYFYMLFLPLFSAGLSLLSVYLCMTGAFRFALLPDMYYYPRITTVPVLYFSWIVLLLVLGAAYFLRNCDPLKAESAKGKIILGGQVVLIVGLAYLGLAKYRNTTQYGTEMLNHYARNEQWDKIPGLFKGRISNFIFMNYLNLALAHQNVLADSLFSFDQGEPTALMVQYNDSPQLGHLMSDIFFSAGNVAGAQRMAFEKSVTDPNPRSLKRLVETHLIYGNDLVAEKYITILEQTLFYAGWAADHRRFLNDSAAVSADPVLGELRRCLPKKSKISGLDILSVADLESIAVANPSKKTAIEYLGCLFLLNESYDLFQAMIEKYYKTEVLPTLPRSFREAIILYSKQNEAYCKQYGVEDEMLQRFKDFRKLLATQNLNPESKSSSAKQLYGNTYWYYVITK
jgi:hypothetical protein